MSLPIRENLPENFTKISHSLTFPPDFLCIYLPPDNKTNENKDPISRPPLCRIRADDDVHAPSLRPDMPSIVVTEFHSTSQYSKPGPQRPGFLYPVKQKSENINP